MYCSAVRKSASISIILYILLSIVICRQYLCLGYLNKVLIPISDFFVEILHYLLSRLVHVQLI